MNHEELLKQAQKVEFEKPEPSKVEDKPEETIEADVTSEATPFPKQSVEEQMNDVSDDEIEIDDTLSNKASDDLKLKEEDVGKVFVIESVEILKPQTKDAEGNRILPERFNKEKDDSKEGYKTKLKISYKDTDYVSFMPNIKWFGNKGNDGKIRYVPWFATKARKSVEAELKNTFTCEVTKIYLRFCVFKGIEPGKLSQSEFADKETSKLIGQKVKLVNTEFDYNDRITTRIDIVEFVE